MEADTGIALAYTMVVDKDLSVNDTGCPSVRVR